MAKVIFRTSQPPVSEPVTHQRMSDFVLNNCTRGWLPDILAVHKASLLRRLLKHF